MTARKDKVCIVTGGASGIGAGIAERLHNDGARVVICDIDRDKAADFAGSINLDVDRQVMKLDVSDAAAFKQIANDVAVNFGTIDALVNNAGIADLTPLEQITRERFDFILGVNAYGMIAGCQAVAEVMKKNKYGKIVNIASTAGRNPMAGVSLYAASKFAIRGLTICYAKELAEFGIRVNAVHPGFIKTPIYMSVANTIKEANAAGDAWALQNGCLLGHAGNPPDVAGAVAYLISPDGDYVTGQSITIDGGHVFA